MTGATSVSLSLPTGWIELDPRAPDLVAELERAIGVPDEAREGALALLAPLAVELARSAAAADVVVVGLYAQAIPIEGADEPFVVTAHALLALSPDGTDLDEALAGLSRDGRDVAPVDLPAGAGVLATGETEVRDPSWETAITARTRRYFVPVPGTSRMAALSFLTPNLDLADQFDDVFAAIAETLEFGWDAPGQSTVTSGT